MAQNGTAAGPSKLLNEKKNLLLKMRYMEVGKDIDAVIEAN